MGKKWPTSMFALIFQILIQNENYDFEQSIWKTTETMLTKSYSYGVYDDDILIKSIVTFKSKEAPPLFFLVILRIDSANKIMTFNDQYSKLLKQCKQNINSTILWWWLTDWKHYNFQIIIDHLPLYLPWPFKIDSTMKVMTLNNLYAKQ